MSDGIVYGIGRTSFGVSFPSRFLSSASALQQRSGSHLRRFAVMIGVESCEHGCSRMILDGGVSRAQSFS